MASFYDLSYPDVDGNVVDFSKFKGKVSFVTNVASRWGVTKKRYLEMEGLLNDKYPEVEVLAFPSGQFVSIFKIVHIDSSLTSTFLSLFREGKS